MKKPENWDNTESKKAGADFPKPPAGGYVLGVVDIEETTSKAGRAMLKIEFDIAEGEYHRFYTKLSASIEKEVFLTHYQLTDGEQLQYFKGLIDTFEHSNKGFKFNFDEKTLVNKKIGANIREEEYEKDGEIKTSLKIGYFATVEEAKAGLPVLGKKFLSEKKQSRPASSEAPKEDDLPFVWFIPLIPLLGATSEKMFQMFS